MVAAVVDATEVPVAAAVNEEAAAVAVVERAVEARKVFVPHAVEMTNSSIHAMRKPNPCSLTDLQTGTRLIGVTLNAVAVETSLLLGPLVPKTCWTGAGITFTAARRTTTRLSATYGFWRRAPKTATRIVFESTFIGSAANSKEIMKY